MYLENEVTDKSEDDKGLLQTTPLFYGASQLNPLMKETQKRVLQLDSQFRNYDNYPTSTDYIINLSEHLHNVVSLRLHSVSIRLAPISATCPAFWLSLSQHAHATLRAISDFAAI